MPRHPMPPLRKKRAFALGIACAVIALQSALWKTAQARRELIRQNRAWRVPEVAGSAEDAILTISADGKRLVCQFPARETCCDTSKRTFDAYTGDSLGDKRAPRSSTPTKPPLVESERNGVRVWLPSFADNAPFYCNRNGQFSMLKKVPALTYGRPPAELRLSPDGKRLTILRQESLWHVDLATQRVLRIVRPSGTKMGDWSSDGGCTLSPDGQYIIALTPRPTLYSALTGHKLRSFGAPLETQCGGCGCVDPSSGFSPDGRLMWAAENDYTGNVAFWRLSDGKRLWQQVFSQWDFDPTGKYVLSSHDCTLYNAATGKGRPLADFATFVFSPDGHQLYTLGNEGRIHHYNLS